MANKLRWYVVCDEYASDKSKKALVWTVSRDHRPGWNTDCGCLGYGLTHADATELADAANAKWRETRGVQ